MLWHVFETHVMRLIIIIIKRAAFIEIGFMVMFCWFLKKKNITIMFWGNVCGMPYKDQNKLCLDLVVDL